MLIFLFVLFLQNFSVRSLDLFSRFLFTETLELLDIDWYGPGDQNSCQRVHVMPRYARPLPGSFLTNKMLCIWSNKCTVCVNEPLKRQEKNASEIM